MTAGTRTAGRRAPAAFTVLAALASTALACRSEPRLAVERVAVSESYARQRLASQGVGSDDLARSAQAQLATGSGFVAPWRARSSDQRYLAQVHVQGAELLALSGGTTAARVILTIELSPMTGDAALRETSQATAPVEVGADGPRAAFEQATTLALQRAVQGFSAQLAAERKSSRALVSDLSSGDARVRDQAMRVLAQRGDKDAVPPLLARLQDQDPASVERAVGALAQLRDPRAVPALIKLVHRRDPGYVARMARIIGDIGGPEARAWLLTMAAGHPDAGVRAAAQEALADVDARGAQPPQASVQR